MTIPTGCKFQLYDYMIDSRILDNYSYEELQPETTEQEQIYLKTGNWEFSKEYEEYEESRKPLPYNGEIDPNLQREYRQIFFRNTPNERRKRKLLEAKIFREEWIKYQPDHYPGFEWTDELKAKYPKCFKNYEIKKEAYENYKIKHHLTDSYTQKQFETERNDRKLKKFFEKKACEESILYNIYYKTSHVFQKNVTENLIFISSTSAQGIKNILFKLIVFSHIDRIYLVILHIFNAKKNE